VQNGFLDLQFGGEDWRGYAFISPERTVLVAQSVAEREEFAATSAIRAVVPILILILLSWTLVGWVVPRVLRPLHAITDDLRRWGKTKSGPLELHGVPDEIMPLVEAVDDLIARLARQLEFRKAFISDAAHELRTPLTALRLQSRNLRASNLPPEQEALLNEMELGFRRMSDLIAQMLQLARADEAPSVKGQAAADLHEVIVDSVQNALPLASEKGIDIGLAASPRATVRADPNDLRTLVGNLIDNAVRYTPLTGTVDVRLISRGMKAILEVKDTGPGIPDDLLDRVFDRFFRVAGSGAEGSGLGLAIVRKLAERYGAQVELENRTDQRGLIARVHFAVAA
jgi:signal transduction histidine kinase